MVTTENGRANLKRFSTADGKIDSVTTGDHDIEAYSASADGSKIVTLVSTPTNIGDLYVVDASTARHAARPRNSGTRASTGSEFRDGF